MTCLPARYINGKRKGEMFPGKSEHVRVPLNDATSLLGLAKWACQNNGDAQNNLKKF